MRRETVYSMSGLSKTLLVLLRLAIGWHFFIEGVSKLDTYRAEAPPVDPPKTVTKTIYGAPPARPIHPAPAYKPKKRKQPWSSEVYLREANGPLAGVFHWLAGDPLLDRLEVLPPEDAEPGAKLYRRLPAGLEKDWRAYFDAFVAHHGIEGPQLERLETHFKQREAETVRWLLEGVKAVTEAPVAGNAGLVVEKKTPERIAKYKNLKERARHLQALDPIDDFHPRRSAELDEAKADLAKLRNELQQDVDEQTAEMKKALSDVVFVEPHKLRFGFMAFVALSSRTLPDALTLVPAYAQREKDYVIVDPQAPTPMAEPIIRHVADWDRLDWIDFSMRWGLTVIGGLLLVGLLTRTACVGGAVFLLLFFLSMPPFPELPANPRAEGHYLFVNKNIIEMLALLALATTRSGRWLGLDALFQFLCPSFWRSPAQPRQPGQSNVQDRRPVESERPIPVSLEQDPFKPMPMLMPESKVPKSGRAP